MKYAIHQISLTDAQIAAVNNEVNVPAYKAKMALMMDFNGDNIQANAADAFFAGHYSHVANITANDLEHVFEISNIGPEQNIERLARKSSLSMGDIVIDENNIVWVVASFGFEEVTELQVVAA
jgi:hypothetical protein